MVKLKYHFHCIGHCGPKYILIIFNQIQRIAWHLKNIWTRICWQLVENKAHQKLITSVSPFVTIQTLQFCVTSTRTCDYRYNTLASFLYSTNIIRSVFTTCKRTWQNYITVSVRLTFTYKICQCNRQYYWSSGICYKIILLRWKPTVLETVTSFWLARVETSQCSNYKGVSSDSIYCENRASLRSGFN